MMDEFKPKSKLIRDQPWFNDFCHAVKKVYGIEFKVRDPEKEDEWWIFTLARIADTQDLSPWADVIRAAAAVNCHDKFQDIAKVLKKGRIRQFNKIEAAVIRNWSCDFPLGVPLKHFPDKCACTAVQWLTGNHNLTEGAYSKTRIRLGFKIEKPTRVIEATMTADGGFKVETSDEF